MKILLLLISSCIFFIGPVKSGCVVEHVNIGINIHQDRNAVNDLAADHLYIIPTAHILYTAVQADNNTLQRQLSTGKYFTFSIAVSFLPIVINKNFTERSSYYKKIGLKLIFPKHYFW